MLRFLKMKLLKAPVDDVDGGFSNACKIRCSDLINISLNQFRRCGESSFGFAHEFFYDFLYGLYFREVGEGHAG